MINPFEDRWNDGGYAWAPAPIQRLRPAAAAGSLEERLNDRYDDRMYTPLVREYYDQSGFHNFGYWQPDTTSQSSASENLCDRLVAELDLPVAGNGRRGEKVLDVACGLGATTAHLLNYFAPAQVTGINISEKQLETARRLAPGARFARMNATALEFPPASFDGVICVEAAFHFNTRERFLREALRVLRPGGRIALSDIVFTSEAEHRSQGLNPSNHVDDDSTYAEMFEQLGFEDVQLEDATDRTWEACRDNFRQYLWRGFAAGRVPYRELLRMLTWLKMCNGGLRQYLLVSARKPLRPRPLKVTRRLALPRR